MSDNETIVLPMRHPDETEDEQQIRLSARLEFAGKYTHEVQKLTERLVPDDFSLEHSSGVLMALCGEMCFWQSMFLAEGGNATEMNALLKLAKAKGEAHFAEFMQSMEGELKVQELRGSMGED